jgi:hypothetical protein
LYKLKGFALLAKAAILLLVDGLSVDEKAEVLVLLFLCLVLLCGSQWVRLLFWQRAIHHELLVRLSERLVVVLIERQDHCTSADQLLGLVVFARLVR